MASVANNEANVERATVPGASAICYLALRIARLSWFDADTVCGSRDWPYLWKESTPAIHTVDREVRNDGRSSLRRANELEYVGEAFTTGQKLSARKFISGQLARTLLLGVVSLVMYLAIFTNQAAVTKYYTGGGVFALVVVTTAVAFALVHGTFASRILEGLLFRTANREKDRGGH